MGIINLMPFLKKKCASAIRMHRPEYYSGRTLAIDAPSSIYKFLVKTISTTNTRSAVNVPVDSEGNQTGHLIGIMYRVLLCLEYNIKPIWVFDGEAPKQKIHELSKRKAKKIQAQTKAEMAVEIGDIDEAVKQTQRTIRISTRERDDSIKMLNLMGVPTIISYGQAEAQCAWLTQQGLAQGVISEDLDNVAFGVNSLIREFSRENSYEMITQKVLEELSLSQQQLIDFCILCGCDYTGKISNIGPVKAHQYIQKCHNIEGVLQMIASDQKLSKRHFASDDFDFITARKLFKEPVVNRQITKINCIGKDIDYDGVRQFLLSKDFDSKRVERWIEIAKKFSQKNQSTLVL